MNHIISLNELVQDGVNQYVKIYFMDYQTDDRLSPTNTFTPHLTSESEFDQLAALTIGEASTFMIEMQCKYASNRKVQRMCRDGAIDCQKITTTRDGNPVTEWLVNEASLLKQIEENEPKWDGENPLPLSTLSGDAIETPNNHGDANQGNDGQQRTSITPYVLARPNQTGVDKGVGKNQEPVEDSSDDMASPDFDDDAIGETRKLVDVLIDNAKLTAELDGAQKLIEAIIDDKNFLREELREARAGRKDVTAIAERMLQTLEVIAIGGRLTPPPQQQNDSRPPIAAATSEQPNAWQHGDNPTEQNHPFRI